MLHQGSKSEQRLGKRIQSLLHRDEEQYVKDCHRFVETPPESMEPYKVKNIGSDTVFLVKDYTGEVFEVQIVGNIDSGAWDDI